MLRHTRLLVEFSHPAQVHKFKHVLLQLQDNGVEVLILSRDKDVMLTLLDGLPLKHQCISRARTGMIGGALELLQREWRTLRLALRFRPDLVFSAHSVAITHIAWLLRVPCLVHEDSEFGTLQQRLYMPFATKVLTSTSYYLDWGSRQVRIPSLEPLAYLHPARFEPDPQVLHRYGLNAATRYAVFRTVAWQAMHDRGMHGLNPDQIADTLAHLQSCGYEKLIFSSESPSRTGPHAALIQPRPADLHHLLAFAALCVSESITVAGEAAVLGVPTLLLNPLRAGHTLELERYGLVERCPDFPHLRTRVTELSHDRASAARWRNARQRLLADKSDMSQELVNHITGALARHAADH